MTRKIAGTCFAALVGFALSAAAQSTPSSPQTPQTTPTSPYPSSQAAPMEHGDKAGKSSKITGCVQSGTTAGTYELTNIKKSGRDSAMADSSSSSKSIKLVAAAGVDLSQHVGHQVEVSGSWSAPSSSSATSAPSSTTPPAAGESASSSSGGKEFNVTDVKMVSATCSAGTN